MVDGLSVDFKRVMEVVRERRAEIAPHDSVKRFTELGVDVFLGSIPSYGKLEHTRENQCAHHKALPFLTPYCPTSFSMYSPRVTSGKPPPVVL